MIENLTEVWLLSIYRPTLGTNPAGWYDVAVFRSPQKVEEAIAKLSANGRIAPDPETKTQENPEGSSWKMKRLDVR